MGFGFATSPGAGRFLGLTRPLIGRPNCRSESGADGGGPPDIARNVRRGPAPLRRAVAGAAMLLTSMCWGAVRSEAQQYTQGQAVTAGPAAAPSLLTSTSTGVLTQPITNLTVGAAGAPIARPPLTINPRVGLSQSFTDNANGDPPGLRRMDTYTTLEPGVLLDFSSAHHRVITDYTATKRWYYDNEDLNQLNHSLNSFSQSELVDGLFFLETQVSLQDTTLNEQGNISADPTVTRENNSSTILVASASPFFRYTYDNHANFETRYRYGRTASLTQGAQDSVTHQLTQNIASGTEFRTFQWGATLDHSRTDYSGQATIGPTGDRNTRSYLGVFSAEVPINREFSIGASVGYERIQDGTLDEQPNGPIWSIGFRYRPGPRTTLQLAYGDRFERRRVSGGFSYIISPRSSFEFSYGTSVNSTTPTAGNSAAFLAPDGFGNLVDVRTGRGLTFNDSIFGITSASFVSDRFESRLLLGHDKGSSTFSAFIEKRSGSSTQSDETGYGVTYGYSRSLSAYLRMGFNIGAAYTKTDAFTGTNTSVAIAPGTNPTSNREDFTITGGGSLDYSFTDTLTGTLAYRYFDRDSNQSGNNLRENLITAGLRKTF
jgi:uncharacterized protein (PEP-CTERM system associated)